MQENTYHRKSFDELTFTDDGMFQAVLSDPEIAAELVERLLHIRVKKVEYPELEKVIAPYYSSKGVRLDVYLRDSEKVIDVEMQSYPQEALGLRTRYYQSMMDADSLLKGQDYPDLPASYILFICKTDPFMSADEERYGLPCYTFETVCKENERVKIDDKTLKVIYNASAYDKAEDKKIRDFLRFIHTNSSGEDDFSRRLSNAVEKMKENEKFRRRHLHGLCLRRRHIQGLAAQGAHLQQGNLQMQPLVVGCPIVDVALVVDFQGTDEEGHRASLRLCQITLPKLLADFQELYRDRIFAHHEAPQVVA